MSHYLPATIDLLPLAFVTTCFEIAIRCEKSGYGTLKFVTLSCDHDKLITLAKTAWSGNNGICKHNYWFVSKPFSSVIYMFVK